MSDKTSTTLTPAQIEAGVEALWEFDPDYSDPVKALHKILSAVTDARNRADQSASWLDDLTP